MFIGNFCGRIVFQTRVAPSLTNRTDARPRACPSYNLPISCPCRHDSSCIRSGHCLGCYCICFRLCDPGPIVHCPIWCWCNLGSHNGLFCEPLHLVLVVTFHMMRHGIYNNKVYIFSIHHSLFHSTPRACRIHD